VVVGEGDDLTDDLLKSLGKYGAAKAYRAKAPEGLAQPVVDAMAKVIQDEGYKYALFGGGLLGFEVGAGLSARLGAGVVMEVTEVKAQDGKLRCERQAEYGYDTVEIELPAVISVGDAINEPRYPSLKAIMGAKKKPLDAVAIGDVDIAADRVGEAGSKVVCGDFKAPPQKAAGEIIEDEDTNETVEKIIAWLDERKLLS
jgi:electron transfer flavoprotein alpha/beta subunit